MFNFAVFKPSLVILGTMRVMKVVFYFDPSCPFSWITSRWLIEVAKSRPIEVTWRPFCLAIKNNELEMKAGEDDHAPVHRDSLRALRLMLIADRDHKIPLIDSYTAAGKIKHVDKNQLDDNGLKQLLADLGLPEELITSADDTTLDSELKGSLDEAMAVVGEDVGVPTIVYQLDDGSSQGYFGPVLNSMPSSTECLAIWDGLVKLAGVKSFYELKRTRPDGDPDTQSTADFV